MAAATAVGGISKEVLFLPGGTEGEQLLSFLQHRTTAKLPTEIQTLCCNIMRTASSLQHSKHRDDFLVEVAAIAENALLTSNEQLIAKLAWDVSKGDPHLYQHLIAEAHKQLPVAAANYRPDNGASFVTYFYRCAWAVMKRLQGYQGDVLHLPDRTRNRLRQVQREQVNVVEEEGREPSSRRLAETCGLKEADVRDMQTYQRMKQLSYETTIAVDESSAGTELTDSTEGGGELSALPQREINGLLRDAMGSLSDTERNVLELMYGLREGEDGKRHTVAAVSRSVGLSRQSVYKAEQRALDKLREYLREVCGGEAQLLLQSG
jgi:RNA polymerase sigma factor (sigma-70 family)